MGPRAKTEFLFGAMVWNGKEDIVTGLNPHAEAQRFLSAGCF